MKVNAIPPFMNFTQQIYDVGRLGNSGAQMKITMKQVDRDKAFLENPDIINNMEEFPNDIHDSSTDQAMKLLDVV